ncbi:MAG: hypothetical protein Q4G24_10570 [Paracoccus sp. (in: a-proteobacteria)]|uniref:hypothetical protein n=1 Tax=Paracoccus sp. TaxID=267 RepID=UPI0026DECB3D|nr:hypothetical protein [Paracoccus sp. (in: a-proteobacteria)]MDO5621901.1 hypothetical protein [Paracoccus sp. (in: a-proteobacteria)]
MTLPDWDSIRGAAPLIALVAGLWARMEVALASGKAVSMRNEREIGRLEAKVEALEASAGAQAVQLARIEESLIHAGKMLDRIDRKLP